MKTAKTLKNLIDFFFIITVLSLGIYLLTFIYVGYKTIDVPSGMDAISDYFGLRGASLLLSFLYTIVFILFTTAIHFLRKTIRPLINRDYFSVHVISNFKKSGQLLTLSGIGMIIIYLTKKLLFKKELWVGIDDTILGFLFLIIIGLFLQLFSTVFTDTKILKEENDLTI